MKSMLKKFLCLTLALLPVLLLTACEEVPAAGMVDLKSESELRQIAEEECPPSTFVRMERQRNKNICHFTDNACGFAFTISSFASESTFEGLKIGYVEHTTNTWEQCYYDYVTDTIKPEADAIASQYGFTIEKLDRTPITPFVYLHIDYYMDNAEEQLGVKCIFERKTQMKGSEIPGLSSHEYYDDDDANRIYDVYFFHTESGEKKLIAVFQVAQNVYYIADAE